jgi:flagellar protein FliL
VKKFLPIIIGMLIAGAAAFVYFQVISKPEPPSAVELQQQERERVAEERKQRTKDRIEGGVYPIGEAFTVNLADPSAFIRTELAVKVDAGTPKYGDEAKGGHDKPAKGAPMPLKEEAKIRDIVIDVLSKQKPSEATSANGRKKIKEEIIKRVNAETEHTLLLDVYFTSYAIQTGV